MPILLTVGLKIHNLFSLYVASWLKLNLKQRLKVCSHLGPTSRTSWFYFEKPAGSRCRVRSGRCRCGADGAEPRWLFVQFNESRAGEEPWRNRAAGRKPPFCAQKPATHPGHARASRPAVSFYAKKKSCFNAEIIPTNDLNDDYLTSEGELSTF